jgi:hypothetical protein
VQLLVYTLVCFGPATRTALLGGRAERRVALAVTWVAFLLVCVALSSATLAQREYASDSGVGHAQPSSTMA